MANNYLVGVRGESYQNDDGTNRQEIIKELKVGQPVNLIADPMKKHDRNAVAVLTTAGKQIGFLPSDARDSSSILRGEPVTATIHKLTGGTNWFTRSILGKKHMGVVLKLSKQELDWSKFNKFREIAEKFDDRITRAEQVEKSGDINQAILDYKEIIREIYKLTEQDKYASAHRYKPAPNNRLSMCLEKQKDYAEALDVIDRYEKSFDPVQPTKSEKEAIEKRKIRLVKRLKGAK